MGPQRQKVTERTYLIHRNIFGVFHQSDAEKIGMGANAEQMAAVALAAGGARQWLLAQKCLGQLHRKIMFAQARASLQEERMRQLIKLAR
jgi:hypothetical protein